jgi:hypothetical protein
MSKTLWSMCSVTMLVSLMVSAAPGTALAGPDPFLGWQAGKVVLWDGAKARPLVAMSASNAQAGKVFLYKGHLIYLEGNALKRKDLATGKITVIDAAAIDATFKQGDLFWDRQQNQLRFVASAPIATDAEVDDYLADEEYEETVKTREVSLRVRRCEYDMPYSRAATCSWNPPDKTPLSVSTRGSSWRLTSQGKALLDVASPLPRTCEGGDPIAESSVDLECTMLAGTRKGLCVVQDFPCGQMAHGVCVWFDLSTGKGREVARGEGIEGYDCPALTSPSGCWTAIGGKVIGKENAPDIQFIHWIQ